MKIKKGFELRDVCGEKVVIAQGIEHLDFSKMISLNETAAYLWENICEHEFDARSLVQLLTKEYEVSEEQAATDVEALLKEWENLGLIEA